MQNINAGLDELSGLEALLNAFLEKKYTFVFFDELKESELEIVLRHDIDFDLRAAYEVALKEHELGVKSTFFLLLSNKNFNLLNHETFSYVSRIRELGHRISLQYDPDNYPESHLSGFQLEVELFERIFEEKVSIVSFHRPSDAMMHSGILPGNIKHTYLPEFTEDVRYISDSRGLWRFGHPLESDAFQQGKSMQLLLHPIWWYYKGKTNSEKIKSTFQAKVAELKKNFSDNSRPFREIENEI